MSTAGDSAGKRVVDASVVINWHEAVRVAVSTPFSRSHSVTWAPRAREDL